MKVEIPLLLAHKCQLCNKEANAKIKIILTQMPFTTKPDLRDCRYITKATQKHDTLAHKSIELTSWATWSNTLNKSAGVTSLSGWFIHLYYIALLNLTTFSVVFTAYSSEYSLKIQLYLLSCSQGFNFHICPLWPWPLYNLQNQSSSSNYDKEDNIMW